MERLPKREQRDSMYTPLLHAPSRSFLQSASEISNAEDYAEGCLFFPRVRKCVRRRLRPMKVYKDVH